MTLAGSAHLEPSGGAGIDAAIFGDGGASGTSIVKEIHLPSGDQFTPAGDSCTFVSFAVWPELTGHAAPAPPQIRVGGRPSRDLATIRPLVPSVDGRARCTDGP